MASPEPSNLRRRYARGAVWLGAGEWLASAVNFPLQIAIARLIGPGALGLYAYIAAINEFLGIIAAFSLNIALIQSQDESQELYDTAFVISGLIGLFGLLAAVLCTPFLSAEGGAQAGWLLIVLAVGRLLVLLAQVPRGRLEREIRYARLSTASALTKVVPNLGALALASVGIGAWCLALRDLGAGILTLALASLWSTYRFRGRISRQAARRLFDYSWPMFAARSTSILADRIDRVAAGSLLGETVTGLYHQARYLAETATTLTRSVTQVSLNVYSRLQSDATRLRESFELMNYFLVRLVMLITTILVAFPVETIQTLLGSEWIAAAAILPWLAIHGALIPLEENLTSLFYASNNVRWALRIRVVQFLYFAPTVVLACWYGRIDLAAMSLATSTALGFGLSLALGYRLLPGVSLEFVGPLAAGVATIGASLVLVRSGAMEAVPFLLRPPLASLGYLGFLYAIEGRKLVPAVRSLYRDLKPR